MKKSVNKAISVGLTSLSILSPILNSRLPVVAMSESKVKDNGVKFDWVSSGVSKSKIELSSGSSSGNTWFVDNLTKTLYAKGDTYINFVLNKEGLNSPIVSISIEDKGVIVGKVENKEELKLLLSDIPSSGSVEVVYSFKDGSIDKVPLYSYFTGVSGGVVGHKVKGNAPKFTYEGVNKDNGKLSNSGHFKGKLKYSFQSDIVDSLLPNIWGTTGYKYKLSLNGEDYSDSRVFTVNHTDSTGKVDIEVDLDGTLKPVSGDCKIEIIVLDNVGNESKYNETVLVDYLAPTIKGTTKASNWLDVVNSVSYFNSTDTVEISYDVSDTESGIKTVSILKDSVEIVNNAKPSGSIIIDSEGVYEVSVVDDIGNSRIYGLSEILLGVSDMVKFDGSAPMLKDTESGILNLDWFVKGSSLTLDISDDIGLSSIKYSLNNEETVVPLSGNPKSASVVIDPFSIKSKSKELKIDLVALDVLGKEVRYSRHYNLDLEPPELDNASVKGDILVVNGKGYAKSPLVVEGVAKDEESGLASLDILKDGVSVSNSLPYTIAEDGVYSIKLLDTVGNETVLSLKDITGKDFAGIVVSGDAPLIEAKVDGTGILDSWYKDKAKLSLKAEDKVAIASVKYTLNDKEISEQVGKSTHEVEVNLEDYVDKKGMVKVSYEAINILGTKSSYERILKLDTKNPEIANGSLTGLVNIVGTVGCSSGTLTLDAQVSDEESGVAKVEVLKDSKVVSTSLPYDIDESGVYEVRLQDGAGHIITKSLKDISGVDIDRILIDKDKPEILRLEGFKPDLEKDGANWYNHTPSLRVSISDDNIDSISIKVNGVEVDKTISVNGEYNIPIQGIEGCFDISILAIDKSKNTTEDSYVLNVDLNKPTITDGVVAGNYKNRGYGLYFPENPVVTLRGVDSGSGIKNYILLDKNKNEVSRDAQGVFLLEGGEYYAKTVDYFDSESDVFSIKDLCKLENNRLVVDSDAPVISTTSPEGGVGDWFSKNVSYNIKVEDNIGISSAKVLINGIEVDSFKADKDITNVSLVADTSKVYKDDGIYSIEVVAEDNAGLLSKWSKSVKIDTTAPKFTGGVLLGSYVDRGDGIVLPSNPSIQISVDDQGIGIKEVTLIDKDGTKVSNTSGLFELSTNEYSLVLEDKLGNKTELTPLKDVCNLPSSNIMIDMDKPVIDSHRPEGVWFSDDVKYSLFVSDNLGLGSIEVDINGSSVVDCKLENNTTLSKNLTFSTKGVTPNEDGSYNVSIKTVDIVGNADNWNDTVYVDKFAPVVEKFIITGKGYLEGVGINSSDKYGFYIDGKTDVEVHISDGSFSSGVASLHYDLINSDGTKREGVADVYNGVAKFSIKEDFKGFISAYAVDRVGNVGLSNKPDGVVSESSNVHINTSIVDINLPITLCKDTKGNFLYKDDISIGSSIIDLTSGVREVRWGINSDVKGVVYIDNDGNITGDTGSIVKRDKNLVVGFEKNLSVGVNENDLSVWVEAVDRVGHTSKNSRVVSIDKDAPIINVSYDNKNVNSFYNKDRVATISIKERSFKSGDVVFNGTLGSRGSWSNVGNDTWVCDVVFSEDGEYQWSVDYTDMVGNIGVSYSSERFTVDKTNPVLNVSFDNNRVESGNFYKDTRVATIVVFEKNFNPSLVNLEGDGTIGGWSSNGDTHTANVVFDTDGEYGFNVNLSDRAGNVSTNFSSGKFRIDKVAPTINISGVQNGVSYKKNISFKVNVEDTNIDTERCSVSLSGRSIGNIDLIGGINGSSGEFTFSGVPEDMKFDDLYTLKAVIYDKAGNLEERTLNYSINRYGSRFDFLDAHLLNNIVKSPEDIILEETSIDRLDIDSCKVVVIRDGKVVPIDKEHIKVDELGGKDGNWVYRYFISKEAFTVDGKYQVQIFSKALDGSSNSSLSQEYSFILDTTKPEIIISGVEGNSSYREVSRKVAIEVRDLSGVKTIKALLNGKEVPLSEEQGSYFLVIQESNKKQNLTVEVTDKAENISSIEVKDFLVTSNVVLSIINSSLTKGVFSAIGVAVLALITVLLKRRKVSKREELELAQEHAKMYHESITGSSTDGGSNSSSDSKQ